MPSSDPLTGRPRAVGCAVHRGCEEGAGALEPPPEVAPEPGWADTAAMASGWRDCRSSADSPPTNMALSPCTRRTGSTRTSPPPQTLISPRVPPVAVTVTVVVAAVAVAGATGASPSQIPRDRRLIHERPTPPDRRSVEPVYNRVPTKDSSARHPHIRHSSSISQVRMKLIRDSRLGHGMPTSRRSVDDLMPKSMARARRRSPLRTLLSASE